MNYIIKHIAELVTCAGGPKAGKDMNQVGIINDGAIVIENGLIMDVGTTAEINERHLDPMSYEIVDASGKAVLPGFVDSHTHFIFGGYRADEFGWRLKGDSYMSIMERGGGIASSVKATREASFEELVEVGRKRLDRLASYGVTTVEGKSGYGLDRETELRQLRVMKQLNEDHPLDLATTFLGPHAVPVEYKGRDREFLDELILNVMPTVKEENLAEFADIFTEKGVFTVEDSEYYFDAARKMGFRLKAHADEMVDTSGAAMAARAGCVSADHLLAASDDGLRQMMDAGCVATLLPATAFSLGKPYARGREMIDMGCTVAMASDYNPGSCHTCSIPLMFSLACVYMHMTVEEAVTALTINGAAALCRQDTVGSIEIGKKADLVFLEHPSIQFLPYCTGMNIVERVMKDGAFIV
ncbi:MAG: imidazolonepropionase [Lachnospiraceae bacterium]|nr:imidazolonepropionase [Lachnospiraceae bacterium]